MEQREAYERWRLEQAEKVITETYSATDLEIQLRHMRTKMSRDRQIAAYLDRASSDARRAAVVRQFREETAEELALASFEEWSQNNGQAKLFA